MDDTNLVEKLDLKHSVLFWKSVIVRMEEWENVLSCLFYRIWENRKIFKNGLYVHSTIFDNIC